MRGEHDPQGAGVPLSRMNSYALALLLGDRADRAAIFIVGRMAQVGINKAECPGVSAMR